MTEANGDYTDYGYDNVYELTSEVMKDSGGSTIYSISWTYDNVGNRATQTKDGNQTSYTYNSMNQMTAAGSASFTYDSNGNTASKTESQATTNYNWDYENRLAKIDNPSGDDYVYEYDGDGIRVRSGHDSGQGNAWDTRFYYDTDAPLYAYLFESDNNKNMTVAYTIDPGGHLISQRRSGATSYHLYDLLGSTRKFLDSGQTVTDSYSYYAFGEVRTYSGSTPNPFRFVGQFGYYDDPSTDFQYLRARYYAPAYGRFLEVDPLMLATGHPYSYVQGCPTSRQDPSGAIGKTPCPPESEYNKDPHCKLYTSNSRKIDERIPAVPCEMCWELGGAHCETFIINPSDPNEVVLGVTCTQHWTCEWYTQTVVVHKWKCWYQWECTYDTCNGQVKDYPPKTVFIPAGQSYESIVPVEPPVYYETKTVWGAAVCEQCESKKKNPSTCGR